MKHFFASMTTARAGEIGDAYPGFAKFMGDNVSSGMAIFDRLPVLNARNLLYMQAELLHLDCQLRAQTEYDHRSLDLTAQSYERNVLNMMQSNCPQWQLILEIRSRLKDYSMNKQLNMESAEL
jgi:hypothetical protein